jgi:hypothetical protein
MQVYAAHPLTREYIGAFSADPDPLEPGAWLVPAHAYPDAPPPVPAGQAVRRTESGNDWELVADHRGTLYRTDTGAAQQHAALGDIPEGLTALPRASPFHAWDGSAWVLDESAVAAAERSWRDAQMPDLFALRDRHRDEVELGISTTLSAEHYAELLGYIQLLRDWPQSDQFPAAESRPVPPAWLAAG